MQNWLQENCPGFIEALQSWNHWARLDYHVWGAMLEKCHKLQPKLKTADELKATLQTIWEELSQEHYVNKAVAYFKCLTAYTWLWLRMVVAINICSNQWCSRGGTRGNAVPQIFCGERRSPKWYQNKGERWYSSVPPSRLAKKRKVYGKLILKKIIEIITTR